MALDGCRPLSEATRLPPELRGITSPLQWQEWDHHLRHHPDQQFARYVVCGIRDGFRVGFDYARSCRSASRNMASTGVQAQVIRDYLATECTAGRVMGPFSPSWFTVPVQISSIRVVPKKTPGKWRLIVDLSKPEGASVNDGVFIQLCSLRYASVEDAIKRVLLKGRGALLAKVGIQRAYRNVPVHPDDRWLLGMQWDGGVFIDSTLPFGLRSAPKIFTAIADAVEWILRKVGVEAVIHYLVDILLVGAPESPECELWLAILLEVFRRLGIPVAFEKREGPATCLSFLGLELDTVAMVLRLPASKLEALQVLIRSWLGRRACSKRDLESLIGSLSHACCVVRAGKTFLRRLFELLAVAHRSHHWVRLNSEFRSDLRWWDTFLAPLNAASFFRSLPPDTRHYHFHSDASGGVGCGVLWAPFWFQLKWSDACVRWFPEAAGESITFQELLAVVLACALWGASWRGAAVRVYCDNLGAVADINSGYSRVPRIMHLLRCLFFIRARFDVFVEAVHIAGSENRLGDAISGDNLSTLFAQVPAALHSFTPVPPILVSLLLDSQVDWSSQAWSKRFGCCFPPA